MARTIRTKVYKFSELSTKAKSKALENWAYETEYFGADECLDSLKKFADHFECELKDYEIDWNSKHGSSAEFKTPYSYDETDGEGEFFGENWLKNKIEEMGDYDKDTFKGFGDCVFTGVCYDEDVADGARKAYFEGTRDLNDILQAGFESLMDSAEKDYEFQQGEEFFADHCEANEYEFTQDGRRF